MVEHPDDRGNWPEESSGWQRCARFEHQQYEPGCLERDALNEAAEREHWVLVQEDRKPGKAEYPGASVTPQREHDQDQRRDEVAVQSRLGV